MLDLQDIMFDGIEGDGCTNRLIDKVSLKLDENRGWVVRGADRGVK